MMKRVAGLLLTAGAVLLCAMVPRPAAAHDRADLAPAKLGVDERLGARVPLGLPFTAHNGQPVQLASYFTGGPVVVTLNYYSCPTLCPVVISNLAGTVRNMGNLVPGRDFRIVTVSIDPNERLQRASEVAGKTHARLDKVPNAGGAWPFLVGSRQSIAALAGSLGVRYSRLENGEFAHPNAIVVLTPKGRISRYLYGLELSPQDLRLALIEASGGSIGGSRIVNHALLYCYHYDPIGKKYVLLASRVMTAAMACILALTVGLLAVLWKRETT